jgi:hypothetical protein
VFVVMRAPAGVWRALGAGVAVLGQPPPANHSSSDVDAEGSARRLG